MIAGNTLQDPPTRRPLRVCFVIDRLARAGTESQLLLLLERLDRQRIEPYLCLLDGHDEDSQSMLPDDCPTLRLGVRRWASLHTLRQAWRFWRFLCQQRIDVVQTYFPDSTRFAAPIARLAGVKGVFGSRRNIGHWMTRRDALIARFYNRWFIDKIIANCDAAAQAVIRQERAQPGQVLVIPNTIDLRRFSRIAPWQPKQPGEPMRVGMVGNLRPIKGVDLFIRAARQVLDRFPDTQFEIAGGGDPTPYERLIGQLGLTGHVHLLGQVDDIPAFLATLDVAVQPSRAEGCSNALLEYMAAGRPIVATLVGDASSFVGDNLHCLTVAPNDCRSLAVTIERLLGDPDLSHTIARAARTRTDHVARDHDVQQHADYYESMTWQCRRSHWPLPAWHR